MAKPKWNPDTCALRGHILQGLGEAEALRQKQVGELLTEIKAQRADVLAALKLSTEVATSVGGRLKNVEEGLDRILNVRANGSQGFEAVLRELMDATKGIRVRRKIINAVAEWFEGHSTLAAAAKWFFPKALVFVLALLLFSWMKAQGIDVDFLKLFQAVRP
jgi:hypothetical protein